jgi:hypothetical protein
MELENLELDLVKLFEKLHPALLVFPDSVRKNNTFPALALWAGTRASRMRSKSSKRGERITTPCDHAAVWDTKRRKSTRRLSLHDRRLPARRSSLGRPSGPKSRCKSFGVLTCHWIKTGAGQGKFSYFRVFVTRNNPWIRR